MNSKHCPHCGHALQFSSAYCPDCGKRLGKEPRARLGAGRMAVWTAAFVAAGLILGHFASGGSAVANAKDAVRAQLKDPESASFGEIRLSSRGYHCGTVNAKNGFGGASGPMRFMTNGRTTLIETPTSGIPSGLWSDLCS